jgi:hypothetical protein
LSDWISSLLEMQSIDFIVGIHETLHTAVELT